MAFLKTCIVFQRHNNMINHFTFMMGSWAEFVCAVDFYFQDNQNHCGLIAARHSFS